VDVIIFLFVLLHRHAGCR